MWQADSCHHCSSGSLVKCIGRSVSFLPHSNSQEVTMGPFYSAPLVVAILSVISCRLKEKKKGREGNLTRWAAAAVAASVWNVLWTVHVSCSFSFRAHRPTDRLLSLSSLSSSSKNVAEESGEFESLHLVGLSDDYLTTLSVSWTFEERRRENEGSLHCCCSTG